MELRELILRNYRNYENLELSFSPNLNVLAGQNAQGKTNILEAVFLSCTGRSHRTSKDKELITWNKDEALVRTKAAKAVGISKIDIYLNSREKKKILINDAPIARLGELMGHLNSVIFSPEDIKLVREGPSERRRFMDMELSQIKPKYFYYLQQYNRILNHRNNLLKELQRKPSLLKTMPAWNIQLAEAGSYITQQRHAFSIALQTIAQGIHKRISHNSEDLTLVYRPSIPFKTGDLHEIKESFLKELEEREKDDIEKGVTSRGCHRDDIYIAINNIDVRTFGSQGQKRTTVLSLKLSELEFMYRETGEYPLLLLDDVMSELDPVRQKMLLEYIGRVQTFITLTDVNQLPKNMNFNGYIYHIKAGKAENRLEFNQPF